MSLSPYSLNVYFITDDFSTASFEVTSISVIVSTSSQKCHSYLLTNQFHSQTVGFFTEKVNSKSSSIDLSYSIFHQILLDEFPFITKILSKTSFSSQFFIIFIPTKVSSIKICHGSNTYITGASLVSVSSKYHLVCHCDFKALASNFTLFHPFGKTCSLYSTAAVIFTGFISSTVCDTNSHLLSPSIVSFTECNHFSLNS
jgi:hypothetical protein